MILAEGYCQPPVSVEAREGVQLCNVVLLSFVTGSDITDNTCPRLNFGLFAPLVFLVKVVLQYPGDKFGQGSLK